MQLLNNIKSFFYKRKLDTALQQKNKKNIRSFKSALLLASPNEQGQIQFLRKTAARLKEVAIKCDYCLIIDDKLNLDPPARAQKIFIKDINWYGIPKSDLNLSNYDLVINLNGESNNTLDYIAASIHTTLRVATTANNSACYDLMIEGNSGFDKKQFVSELLRLLPSFSSVKTPSPEFTPQ